jgi:hypothetical protein
MSDTELREHLTSLHQELKSVGVVDEESQKLLETIHSDVQMLLAHNGTAPSEHHATARDRLAESARHFDVSHPKLAGTIRTVVHTLNNLGI